MAKRVVLTSFDVEFVSNPEGLPHTKRYVGVATEKDGARFNEVLTGAQMRRYRQDGKVTVRRGA